MDSATPGASMGVDDLQDLFDRAPCGYVLTTSDGTIARVNLAIAEWLGHPPGALVGTRFQDLLKFAGRIFYDTHLVPLLRMQGGANEIALDFLRADGSVLKTLVNASERRDSSGDVLWIRIAIFNTADRRVYEGELLATRNALKELTASLESRIEEGVQARHQLEEALRQSQKMEAVGQLTGGLAHDFNNLLTGISGNLELLQLRAAQGRSSSDLDRYIRAAQGAAKRAAALTHRLLAFSRRQTLDPKPTDINRLVADLEELLRRSVEPAVHLEVVGASGLWPALVDANQLENAILNLCINARDAMPDGGRITIETANRWLDHQTGRKRDLPPGQYLSIAVSDTGVGMSKEVIDRAFEPFFTTKPLGSGTGLGLSMVYGFARQSGGQVRIYSEVGQGTTITIYLPRHGGPLDAQIETPDEADLQAIEALDTILVVDDEPTVRMLVMEVLADFGYQAIEAFDGQSALNVLQSGRRIDLLVTDVGLPGGVNGRQLADAGRALRPGLKVLFITGYADNAVIGSGRLDRDMEILTKPFAVAELGRRIKVMVGRGEPPSPRPRA